MLFAACKGLRQTGSAKKYDLFILPEPLHHFGMDIQSAFKGIRNDWSICIGICFWDDWNCGLCGNEKIDQNAQRKRRAGPNISKGTIALRLPYPSFPAVHGASAHRPVVLKGQIPCAILRANGFRLRRPRRLPWLRESGLQISACGAQFDC